MRRLGLVVTIVLLLGAAGWAQESPEEQKAPALTPQQQAMMEAWAKAATPGEPQRWLSRFEGTWNLEVKSWMDPAAPPEVSKGTATMRMILGGRYLEERVDGTMMEGPFQGLGYTGYDNVAERYVSVWMDSMGTGIMKSEGAYDAAARTMTMSSEYLDPVTRSAKHARTVTRYESDDEYVFKYFDTAPDGSEYVVMQITYTRK